MDAPENWLLCTRLRTLRDRLAAGAAGPEADALWRAADRDVAAAGASEDATVALPVMERSLPDLAALLDAWDRRAAPLPAWDQAVLKRAMNAFKKRLKLTRADDEVSSNRNPLSRGTSSSIVGVRAPEAYTEDVWRLLVLHGRLRDAGGGLYEPAGAGE